MKKKMLGLVLSVGLVVGLSGCGVASVERGIKDMQSSVTGLDRVVEVYDYNGELLKKYRGKIDIEAPTEGSSMQQKVKFDVNGKRVMIYNGIVVVEEE